LYDISFGRARSALNAADDSAIIILFEKGVREGDFDVVSDVCYMFSGY